MRARSIGTLLCAAVLAGLALAAAALPVTALLGLAAKATTDAYLDLPSALSMPALPQATSVYANDGKTLITKFYDENRHDVTLAEVAPVMAQAIVAAEDARFFEHGGVDLRGVLRAMVSDAHSGEAAQGASTLTMQYVRNVLQSDPSLTPQQRSDARADTPVRKIQEIKYAVALERQLSKQDILERYLNIAYYGEGAYGIDAASQTYFSKPASQLTLSEAALLAGLVQAPDAYNPVDGDQEAALGRRSYVLDAMVKMGAITAAQAAEAQALPIALKPQRQPNDCASIAPVHNDWGFFCDYFRQWWDAQPQFGATVAERDAALRQGGYTVVTSLDPNIQAVALAQSLKVYPYGNKRALPMAVVVPGSGRVLAMAVNRHYSLDGNPAEHPKYPNTVNQLIAGGGSVTGYQTGSTFKMFTMLAALEAGKELNTSFDAPAKLVSQYRATGAGTCGGFWCPGNENPEWMDGIRTMWTGFGRSVNTYFVWLEQQVGPAKAVEMAQRLGITFRAPTDAALAANPGSWGAFTLGVVDTTPLDLANAYATVAAGGMYCAPLPVNSITDATGKALAAGEPNCKRVLDPDVAAAAADAARCPVGQQSAYRACDGGTATMVSGILGRPVGGKTGSSEQNATETFVGFTPQVAAAGIATNPDNPRDYVGSGVSAAVDIAVARTMAAASVGLPVLAFPTPSKKIALGNSSWVTKSGPVIVVTKPDASPIPIPIPTPKPPTCRLPKRLCPR